MKTAVLTTLTVFALASCIAVASGQIGSGLEFGSGFSPVTTVTVTPTPTATVTPTPAPSSTTNPTTNPSTNSSPTPTTTTDPSPTQNPSVTPNPTPAIPELQILPIIAFLGVTGIGITVFFYYNNKRKSEET